MLQLLAEENNMIVTMASPHQIQSMLKGKAPGRVAEALAELAGLQALLGQHLQDLLGRSHLCLDVSTSCGSCCSWITRRWLGVGRPPMEGLAGDKGTNAMLLVVRSPNLAF